MNGYAVGCSGLPLVPRGERLISQQYINRDIKRGVLTSGPHPRTILKTEGLGHQGANPQAHRSFGS